ncbi:serine/threonine protein kinase [Pendulispora rubella]|uniref:Serine/threonine protein kinase n=1 Tax=Pendulispora rubella TaxID=2741070 RepID=A0ABZ2KZQ2_9BACT
MSTSQPTDSASEDEALVPGDEPPSGPALAEEDVHPPPPYEEETGHSGPAESLLGTVISGRYRIEKLLGEGGMGAVYQAEHTHMRKRLAVKVLHAEMSRLPEVVARFEREAMAAAHIDHPNVATATDFGKLEDGSFFLVLEYVEGRSLRDAIAAGPLEVGRAMRILRQIAAALQRAHALGIVHRDLKPENVMLIERDSEPDFVKVLDFGIAKVPVAELSRDEHNRAGPAGQALTQLGMVYGTPEYMAPEQALGQNVTPSADVYALGIMTYEMLAGERPFDHESKVTLLGMHVTAPVPPFSQKAPGVVIPPEVQSIVFHMLEKESAHRFRDAKELIDALDGIWLAAYGVVPSANPGSTANPRPSLVSSPRDVFGSQPDASGPQQLPSVELPALPKQGFFPSERLAQLRQNPKLLLFAGLGAIGLIAVVFLVVMVASMGKKTDDASTADAAAAGGETAQGAPKGDPGIDTQVAAALDLIEKGDATSAIEKLTPLEKEHPERADVHRALQKAYSATKDPKESLREAALWLELEPTAIDDLKLDEDVRNAALARERDVSDMAFALLEKKMGSAGPDILYDFAYGQWASQSKVVSERARAALLRAQTRKLANPALLVTLDLRAATSCEDKKSLLPRARTDGDARTIELLRTYNGRYACGFLNRRTCYTNPCLGRDGSVTRTISEIESRGR